MTHAALEVASEVADQTVRISDLEASLGALLALMEMDIAAGTITPGEIRRALIARAKTLVSKRVNREG